MYTPRVVSAVRVSCLFAVACAGFAFSASFEAGWGESGRVCPDRLKCSQRIRLSRVSMLLSYDLPSLRQSLAAL